MSMLREATCVDVPVLVEMMEEFYRESAIELDHTEAAASFRSLLDQPHFGTIWLAYDGSEAAGYVIMTVRFAMEFAGLSGAIDDLYVRPSARRKGFGKLLIESLLIECEDRGLAELHVEVEPGNEAAQALYLRFGLLKRTDDRDHLSLLLRSEF
jgi:ribosomal protein S18 acetylase RimI-like enzyme